MALHSAAPVSDVRNLADLRHLLALHGVDTSRWGTETTKSLEHLWDEIVSGESAIHCNPLRRVVPGVVQIVIRRNGHMLIEGAQVLADGRRRSRRLPPSEKMMPGENATAAALRCLQEELNLDWDDIDSLRPVGALHQKVLMSKSYPGLLSEYTVHQVEARVRGLPETDFWTLEHAINGKQTVKRHYWVWEPMSGSAN